MTNQQFMEELIHELENKVDEVTFEWSDEIQDGELCSTLKMYTKFIPDPMVFQIPQDAISSGEITDQVEEITDYYYRWMEYIVTSDVFVEYHPVGGEEYKRNMNRYEEENVYFYEHALSEYYKAAFFVSNRTMGRPCITRNDLEKMNLSISEIYRCAQIHEWAIEREYDTKTLIDIEGDDIMETRIIDDVDEQHGSISYILKEMRSDKGVLYNKENKQHYQYRFAFPIHENRVMFIRTNNMNKAIMKKVFARVIPFINEVDEERKKGAFVTPMYGPYIVWNDDGMMVCNNKEWLEKSTTAWETEEYQ